VREPGGTELRAVEAVVEDQLETFGHDLIIDGRDPAVTLSGVNPSTW
jgi:hypothetical protein